MADIKISTLLSEGVEIGGAVMLSSSLPYDLDIGRMRLLRSGLIETNTLNFNTSIFSEKYIYSRSPIDISAFSSTLNINGLSIKGNDYVAVGENGTIASGINPSSAWTTRTSGTAQNINNIDNNGANFIAVANGGTILTSSDGASWSADVDAGRGTLYDVFVTSSNTVILVSQNNNIYRTYATWSAVTTGSSATIVSGTAGGDVDVIAGASGVILWSDDDCLTFTEVAALTAQEIRNIGYGDGIYVAFTSEPNPELLTSNDGKAWVSRGRPFADSTIDISDFNSLNYIDGKFYVGLNNGRYGTSEDGINWSISSRYSSNKNVNAFAYDSADNQIVAVGNDGAASVFEYGLYAGCYDSYEENGSVQYIRIS